jgi:hypothetical protein
VLLGMGAMMAGSLQAPLAALTAMLELTDNPEIILPGMLAVVVAGITASEFFGKRSLFITMLRASGLDYDTHPVSQALRRVGVGSVMNRSFARVPRSLVVARARQILADAPTYLLVESDGAPPALMPAIELARFIESRDAGFEDDEAIDLLAMPAKRLEVETIGLQANLQEARAAFAEHAVDALVVRRMTAPGIFRIYGILTPDIVERTYRL